jgi:hypothetical protein
MKYVGTCISITAVYISSHKSSLLPCIHNLFPLCVSRLDNKCWGNNYFLVVHLRRSCKEYRDVKVSIHFLKFNSTFCNNYFQAFID